MLVSRSTSLCRISMRTVCTTKTALPRDGKRLRASVALCEGSKRSPRGSGPSGMANGSGPSGSGPSTRPTRARASMQMPSTRPTRPRASLQVPSKRPTWPRARLQVRSSFSSGTRSWRRKSRAKLQQARPAGISKEFVCGMHAAHKGRGESLVVL